MNRVSSSSSPLDERAVQHDERLVHADRDRVPDRAVGDVQLGQLTDVERRRGLGVEPVDLRELPLVDPDRRAEVLQPEGALVDQPGHLAQDEVEALELPQGDQGATVGGVLYGDRKSVV